MRISDWSSDVCSSDLRNLATGVVSGRNIYRCIVAMAGGEAKIAGIVQDGPVGYRDFDAEPNREGAYQPVIAHIGFIQGSVVQIRSEEHTSELQSLMRISYAVFCLKKKKHDIYRPDEGSLDGQTQTLTRSHLENSVKYEEGSDELMS